MREIEFRGISQLDGSWVYGDFQRERIIDKSGERYFYSIGVINEGDWTNRRNVIPVFEQTISQSTGLKDKNGKKIFEGDIVIAHYFFENHDPVTLGAFEDEDEITGKIVCDLDGLRVIDRKDEYRQLPLSMIQEPTEELEVIGNIYDNPELVKE